MDDDRYAPPADLAARANVTAADEARLRAEADADLDAFWLARAKGLDWEREPTQGYDGSGHPFVTWFADGRLNVAHNCVDRHVDAGRGEKVALSWEGEPGDRVAVTYADLQRRVAQAAHGLTELGVRTGDVVVVYLPVLVETVVVMLACARIGALHSLVFGGFSAEALRFRVTDGRAKVVVTTDGQYRRGKAVPVKENADHAVAGTDVEHVLVVRRTGQDVPWTEGRDVWWHDVVDRQPTTHDAEAFDAETPLFLIYTSGTTGRPKGLVHTMGGYLTQTAWTAWACFDHRDDDVYWCQADLAWVTAHTYEVYGPLANGVTQVLYEGTPDTPHRGRHFEIIARHGVTVYYTAPTLVRTFMTWGTEITDDHDLSSLRLLGSVGEAINPEAWRWLHEHVGGGRAPIVDTWWQSETGAAMVAPLPGTTTLKPGSATRPLPGISVRVVREDGSDADPDEGGLLVVDRPWPAVARTVWGDPDRYVSSYFSKFSERGWYLAGDGARIDDDGYVWLQGRVDDVMNVSGHRLSSIELESALVSHPRVGEAAVIGAPDPTTGQAVVAFVVTRGEGAADEDLTVDLRAHVTRELGPVARPQQVHVVSVLPKTRSGKILRRLLLDLASGREPGDTTSIVDPTALDQARGALRAGEQKRGL
ncbi:acetate--CoA ligase [Actinomycetospora corticicola]|uniref:Acetate--CoA ligase n=1 Tax=Actinomycetospora corticicola TaxID=663602 RepID=A0A7Y9DT59_9PSEU|nr:acetate--CoA ligase [Actinomycetospora corticicola]NYD35021.1 acetyl-CoA synthetase [Actinomycetospora corticicola]